MLALPLREEKDGVVSGPDVEPEAKLGFGSSGGRVAVGDTTSGAVVVVCDINCMSKARPKPSFAFGADISHDDS